jgi:hypothetical protein
MQFILKRKARDGRKAKAEVPFCIVIQHLKMMLFDLHRERIIFEVEI